MLGHGHYRLLGRTTTTRRARRSTRARGFSALAIRAAQRSSAPPPPGRADRYRLPRAWLGDSLDFSYSGVKTALLRATEKHHLTGPTGGRKGKSKGQQPTPAAPFPTYTPPKFGPTLPVADLAAAYQEAIIEPLVEKTARAARESGATMVLLAGGVAANGLLRERLGRRLDLPLRYPPLALCTDNAAMIGAAAAYRLPVGRLADFTLDVRPNFDLSSLGVPDATVQHRRLPQARSADSGIFFRDGTGCLVSTVRMLPPCASCSRPRSAPGIGDHLAPLARALQMAGHEVAFAATPFFCAEIGAYGFQSFRLAPTIGSTRRLRREGCPRPAQADAVLRDVFLPDAERRLPEVLAVARAWRPDLIVREHTEYAGALAAESLGLPHAAVQISAWRGAIADPAVIAALDRLRGALGLPPDPDLAMPHRHLTLLPFPPRYPNPAVPLLPHRPLCPARRFSTTTIAPGTACPSGSTRSPICRGSTPPRHRL
jgi:hypothetical protein